MSMNIFLMSRLQWCHMIYHITLVLSVIFSSKRGIGGNASFSKIFLVYPTRFFMSRDKVRVFSYRISLSHPLFHFTFWMVSGILYKEFIVSRGYYYFLLFACFCFCIGTPVNYYPNELRHKKLPGLHLNDICRHV